MLVLFVVIIAFCVVGVAVFDVLAVLDAIETLHNSVLTVISIFRLRAMTFYRKTKVSARSLAPWPKTDNGICRSRRAMCQCVYFTQFSSRQFKNIWFVCLRQCIEITHVLAHSSTSLQTTLKEISCVSIWTLRQPLRCAKLRTVLIEIRHSMCLEPPLLGLVALHDAPVWIHYGYEMGGNV